MPPPRLNILGFGGVRVRVVITRFRDKNEVFVLFIDIYIYINWIYIYIYKLERRHSEIPVGGEIVVVYIRHKGLPQTTN